MWPSPWSSSVHFIPLDPDVFPSSIFQPNYCTHLLFCPSVYIFHPSHSSSYITRVVLDEEYQWQHPSLCTFPPFSCYFISPRPKYSPQHFVLNQLHLHCKNICHQVTELVNYDEQIINTCILCYLKVQVSHTWEVGSGGWLEKTA